MAKQWTGLNPGVGSVAPTRALVEELRELATSLDDAQSALNSADDVFDEAWKGEAAKAARAQLKKLVKRSKAIEAAVNSVRSALTGYADEVADIKALAAPQRELLEDASRRLQDERVTGVGIPDEPYFESTARRDFDAASAELAKLTARRRAADSTILQTVRAALATTWDVAAEEFPDARSWTDEFGYDYTIDDSLGFSADDYTAEELMEFFKKYPSEVFPFPVSGDSEVFEDGAIFTLSDTISPDGVFEPNEIGQVVVTTTATSVKFTVISDDYFDGPGSTIEFSIVEVNGEFALRKVAHAVDTNIATAIGAIPGANWTWDRQANNLKDVVEKYGTD